MAQAPRHTRGAVNQRMNRRAVQYVVILGCPRSGTSFLGDALRALPNAECIFGHHLPVSIPHLVEQAVPDDVHRALGAGFHHSLETYAVTVSNSRAAALQRWMRGEASIADPWRAFRGRRVVERVVYKEPFLAFDPRFAFDALPASKLIFMLRDGRDCAQSLVTTYDVLTDEKLASLQTAEAPLGRLHDHRYVPWWVEPGREAEFLASVPYVRAIWMWKEIVRRSYAFTHDSAVAATGRVLEVRYEDLGSDASSVRESVAEYLGVEADQRLRRRFKSAHKKSIASYRKRDRAEIREAERVAGKELELCGYL
jgi:Sulfotransferase family